MVVTDIIEISKKQCKIMVDYEFAFVLYKGELHLYGIKSGEDLKKENYDRIINEVLMKRTKLRAMNLLKSRPYTEKKLREKLQMGQYPKCCIEEAVSYVKSYGYINDEQYAADYLFYHGNQWNKVQIFRKLKEKGIDDVLIERAYENYCQNGDAPKEEELILGFLKKKRISANNVKEWEFRSKIIRSLLQKGFSYDRILPVLDSYGKSDEETGDL
ncbi:MAG: RecX family transcriptional regulator [Lachnospiraceae bacterium]|nr:RecX family transcriptional regulator [Lachnospiraceae bacterium]